MKLAEALILRVELQKKIINLKGRIINNAKCQEGEEPSEKPSELLKELESCIVNLEDLIKRINKTNSITMVDNNNSIADIIAEKDCLAQRLKIMRDLSSAATVNIQRYTRNEIKVHSSINVSELQKDIDKISKEYRLLDTKLQSTNWTIDLI